MADPSSLSDLEAYARERIAAQRHPNDYHFFTADAWRGFTLMSGQEEGC